MRVPKALLGKDVKVIWLDPKGGRMSSVFPSDHRDVPRGKMALAKWTTHGVVESIEDGVVVLRKALGEDPVTDRDQTHELEYDAIPEDLIVKIVEKTDGQAYGDG